MRNATVAALIYEFLFDVYRLIDAEREHNEWLPDEHSVVREAFFHSYISCWEWSTSVLEEVGATKTLQLPHIRQDPNRRSPYSYPLMTLDDCRVADFLEFETFDNYCYAMFTFYQLIGQTSRENEVNLAVRSPRFLEAVASKDDVFLIEDIHCVKFRRDRFEEKVMTRWDEMQLRIFRRKDGVLK
ncbi:hypothetical protein EN904_02770 [Mesorhizobium sp. M7A.F.Ca.CA.001.07.2.1]|uniref:hypothetical protein n=1 Tax=Mesorhizobium sp. M7A.F.Ca.CA.004.04.2.1 TaxID=2496677 RepID=UPI000FCC1110|nr:MULTISPECIES: hypothetical protein [unclassified Mesorhizobium]RUX74285.1 hypothetical protein EN983_19675 [Mesorhizobium sp. M7A.F.Ca.CA.004.08.2.1]RUX84018.1 hypothetical protein EN982_24890 [Mesorhizobium sp. M7A.F.Ca.CA.004.08.1.1]RUX99158.1 hypothetical protein EN985_28820 [Mesorhizobium sp. M7A.F.Ca.CA.004.04.1.1]RUY23206.1 hypothetical protein EN984_17935 [Mesorhizobium sp. M7A.F.Ca.CA.004.12.1.1]RUY51453.1 hypothetical protein EN973_26790 [Mesorhizobium sp. M7A.F.Ca.CA.001.12.1.1]R